MDQNQIPSFQIPNTDNQPDSAKDVSQNLPIQSNDQENILPAPVQQAVNSDMPSLQSTAVQPGPPVGPTQNQSLNTQDSHLIADDVDVIEKEWVERAKKVVALTSQDPYLETKELSKLKNVYMKKRFDKDLPPIPEDV